MGLGQFQVHQGWYDWDVWGWREEGFSQGICLVPILMGNEDVAVERSG